MATVLDIVQRALRKAKVLGHGANATAEDAAPALEDLNMMLAAWTLAAVDITHTALDLTDAFPLADEFEEGTVYMLASRIVVDFAFPAQFDADDFFRRIQAAYAVVPDTTIPAALTCTVSQGGTTRRFI